MSDDLIKRSDAIKACDILPKLYNEAMKLFIKRLPSAYRPQGDVDAVATFMREMHNLEQGYITIDEFDERIKPLNHLCYGRPQGEWIEVDDYFIRCKCSICGWESHKYEDDVYGMPYCPNCGARMKGANDETISR